MPASRSGGEGQKIRRVLVWRHNAHTSTHLSLWATAGPETKTQVAATPATMRSFAGKSARSCFSISTCLPPGLFGRIEYKSCMYMIICVCVCYLYSYVCMCVMCICMYLYMYACMNVHSPMHTQTRTLHAHCNCSLRSLSLCGMCTAHSALSFYTHPPPPA